MATILVCGGRDFDNYAALRTSLDAILRNRGWWPVHIVSGGARGADNLAIEYAKLNNFSWREYRADWKAHGRAAGPIRNQEMLDDSQPKLVVAFPGGRGTADMVRRAKSAGVEILKVDAAPLP